MIADQEGRSTHRLACRCGLLGCRTGRPSATGTASSVGTSKARASPNTDPPPRGTLLKTDDNRKLRFSTKHHHCYCYPQRRVTLRIQERP